MRFISLSLVPHLEARAMPGLFLLVYALGGGGEARRAERFDFLRHLFRQPDQCRIPEAAMRLDPQGGHV